MSQQENTKLALKYMGFLNTGEIDQALALASDDATFWHPLSGAVGKEELRITLKHAFGLMLTINNNVLSTTAEADRVSLELEFKADLSNGRTYENQYHFMFVIKDGKIHSLKEYVDSGPAKAAFF
ncbi:nuclear transport factor 2 family protein [Pseudomonas silesiensis]|uniref:nuclear transport factor 2 family protein n=1 Tax=Pseudomonas silesiensis TaxID=1853130 RepID=UPI0034D5E9E3